MYMHVIHLILILSWMVTVSRTKQKPTIHVIHFSLTRL